jgi:hypothetical protein
MCGKWQGMNEKRKLALPSHRAGVDLRVGLRINNAFEFICLPEKPVTVDAVPWNLDQAVISTPDEQHLLVPMICCPTITRTGSVTAQFHTENAHLCRCAEPVVGVHLHEVRRANQRAG